MSYKMMLVPVLIKGTPFAFLPAEQVCQLFSPDTSTKLMYGEVFHNNEDRPIGSIINVFNSAYRIDGFESISKPNAVIGEDISVYAWIEPVTCIDACTEFLRAYTQNENSCIFTPRPFYIVTSESTMCQLTTVDVQIIKGEEHGIYS